MTMPKDLILFVHGLGGEPATTWGNFPTLIAGDPALRQWDVDSFGFPTSLFSLPIIGRKYPKIQTLADALHTFIETKYADRNAIILACHSLGGLIARRYLVDEAKRQADLRVKGLILYAVPNHGAGLASVASHISWRHNQLAQLCRDSDLIRDLDADWTHFVGSRVAVRYVLGGLDRVVDERSARRDWGERNVDVIADRNHRSLVKPTGADDLAFLILKRVVQSIAQDPGEVIARYATAAASKPRPKCTSAKGFRVVAFDLDGTLLRGIDFSWTVVWKHLEFPEAVYKGAMRDYRKGGTTYQEWCDIACAHFQSKSLRRTDFPNIVKGITLTNNLRQTIAILRNAGLIVALVSGGIDTFLEELLPDAADLFDYICINRVKYEQPSGVIAGVDATPFDFEGKTLAVKAICERHGCTLKEAVFVGEGFNDEDVVNKVGLSIAYPPGETAIEAASIGVHEDDLSKILEYIL
jgi:phosphoserine phosphatase/pimeloyl-ACP methyl ester carboxylesterase